MRGRCGFQCAASTRRRPRASRCSALVATGLAIAGGSVAAAAFAESDAAASDVDARRDARIGQLRAAVERDQEAIRVLLTHSGDEPEASAGDLRATPAVLREIARRLPAAQAELRHLEETRAAKTAAAGKDSR